MGREQANVEHFPKSDTGEVTALASSPVNQKAASSERPHTGHSSWILFTHQKQMSLIRYCAPLTDQIIQSVRTRNYCQILPGNYHMIRPTGIPGPSTVSQHKFMT